MNTKQAPHSLGQLLNLSAHHHFFDLPVWIAANLDPDQLVFALLFDLDGRPQLVAEASSTDFSEKWQSASIFPKENLLEALTHIPLRALPSCQLLALPPKQVELRSLKQLYPDFPLVSQLPELPEQPLIYNPYRDAYEAQSATVEPTSYQVTASERDYEGELQAFEVSRKGEVKQIPLRYQDQKTGQQVKLYVRGWYLFDGKPPLQISWKPSHTRKASWRSSYVGVDKKTGLFFFRGELYKDKQSPIFLKGLRFSNQQVSDQLKKNWQAFESIIEDQKTAYLANQDQDN